jgi:tyrosine-protein phosphatase YwqE
MFFFFKSKPTSPFPFHELKADVHSHIIPGIDDGAPDEETSIMLVKGLIDLGFETFTATPHVMEDIWRNNSASIMAGYARLVEALKQANIMNSVRPAAEYLVDANFEQLLASKSPLLSIRGNLVLIEMSFIEPPIQFKEVIFEMQMQGYQPVLAHPERYGFYHHNKRALEEIKNTGCLFQSNLLAFSGYYGPEVLRAAERMAKDGMIDLLGTDLHHERHLEALRELKLTPAIGKVLEQQF